MYINNCDDKWIWKKKSWWGKERNNALFDLLPLLTEYIKISLRVRRSMHIGHNALNDLEVGWPVGAVFANILDRQFCAILGDGHTWARVVTFVKRETYNDFSFYSYTMLNYFAFIDIIFISRVYLWDIREPELSPFKD